MCKFVKWFFMYQQKNKEWVYILTIIFSISILFGVSLFPDVKLDSFLHVVFSISIFLTSLMVGIIALVSYYSQKNSSLLFIGMGFFGAGILEVQHILLNLPIHFDFIAVFYNSILAWHWYSSRLYLSILLWLSWLVNISLATRNRKNNEQKIYFVATLATIISFVVYFFTPLFSIGSDLKDFTEHLMILPAVFFFFTIIGFLRKHNGLNNSFQHFLINALILNLFAEVGYNLNKSHDSLIVDVAHFYVFISYILVFVGLVYHTYEKYNQVGINNEIIEKINASLLKELNDKKIIREKLKLSEERYRILVESSPDMIAVVQNKKLVYINQSGLFFLKAKSENEIIGQSIFKIISTEFHPMVERRIATILREKKNLERIIEKYRLLDGEEVEVEVQPIYVLFKGKPSIQLVIRDITERKKSEEILRQSEKLLAVGELAAGIAHEIRNPLTSLKGFTQLLQSGAQKKEEYFQVMLSELKSIDRVIGEFLLLAKPEKKNFSIANINKVLEEVSTLLHAQAIMNDVEIVENKEKELPLVQCELNQMKQMFTNIIKNAIEKMPHGGKVKIRTKIANENFINIQIVSEVKHFEEGIHSELITPLLTKKEQNSGIGLMISCKIVENHQGMIDFKEYKRKGNLVDIMLPVSQPDKKV